MEISIRYFAMGVYRGNSNKNNGILGWLYLAGFLAFFILPIHNSFAQSSNQEQIYLNSISGNWRSIQGYVVSIQGSSCYSNQPVFISSGSNRSAFLSYTIGCSTGFQSQMQGLDINPARGTYQSGYNSVSSRFLYNNGIIVGIERKMTTTWGFGSMVNYQYQTVRISANQINNDGLPQGLAFDLINSQTNVQNGLETTYHLDLIH